MACLWDNSSKNYGDMNYYNRLTDEWYDDKIKNMFIKISKGNIAKSSDSYFYSNFETISNIDPYSDYHILIGTKKTLKIIVDINYSGNLYYDYYFEIFCARKENWESKIEFDERNSKKQYDRTTTYTMDMSNLDWYNYIQIFLLEYQENFNSFYYNDYKAKIINEIN